jgi:replicative DNA helicase
MSDPDSFQQTINKLKVPPQSLEAEQAVIGAAMLDNDCIADLIAEGFSAEFFYHPQHRAIWGGIAELANKGWACDLVTLATQLDGPSLEQSGGLAYLAEIARNTPSVRNAHAYARVIRNRYVQRRWIGCAQQISAVMFDDSFKDHDDRIAAVDTLINAMVENERSNTQISLNGSIKEYIEYIDAKHQNPGIHGLLTGFKHVDYRLNGMQPGDLVVIAGRPAMGKTTVMTNMAVNMARAGNAGMIFSLEMPHKKLTQRMISGAGKVKIGLLQSAKVQDMEGQWDKLSAGVMKLRDLPIVYDDQGGLSVQEITSRTKREHRRNKLSWIMVDHIGLVDSRRHKDRDDLNIADVTRTLKRLAKELGIVVIALSQVNRKCEERSNKRPRMSDLLGSSAIEQDADSVLMLYRDKYYDENTQYPNQIEIISAKLRDGEPGIDFLHWNGEYNQVDDWAEGSTPVHAGFSAGKKTSKGYEGD